MTLETSFILALALPAFFFVYLGFQLDDRHAVFRMFLTAWGWLFMLGVPVVGAAVASKNNYPGVQEVMDISLLPMVSGFVFFCFYLIILYLRDTGRVLNQDGEDFDNEFS